ncbi:hypothetical protein GLAREA_06585 [Glarea lozoyensis ATCC 20868]|uniref:Uncharacterized protein n=1 Tax=Glarea lozoyensis (strain ATCC 20868 / MF5171) TaxID=1116229 RepID=S3D535_GLAL2|nr:uncharacterized protein GLAREA_06585 [Glarea lozoyensis ATCC 20868]EPE33572.1 hypothetical protein GLAREA_06585 [Glarea lozoyensis ATCC 20868]
MADPTETPCYESKIDEISEELRGRGFDEIPAPEHTVERTAEQLSPQPASHVASDLSSTTPHPAHPAPELSEESSAAEAAIKHTEIPHASSVEPVNPLAASSVEIYIQPDVSTPGHRLESSESQADESESLQHQPTLIPLPADSQQTPVFPLVTNCQESQQQFLQLEKQLRELMISFQPASAPLPTLVALPAASRHTQLAPAPAEPINQPKLELESKFRAEKEKFLELQKLHSVELARQQENRLLHTLECERNEEEVRRRMEILWEEGDLLAYIELKEDLKLMIAMRKEMMRDFERRLQAESVRYEEMGRTYDRCIVLASRLSEGPQGYEDDEIQPYEEEQHTLQQEEDRQTEQPAESHQLQQHEDEHLQQHEGGYLAQQYEEYSVQDHEADYYQPQEEEENYEVQLREYDRSQHRDEWTRGGDEWTRGVDDWLQLDEYSWGQGMDFQAMQNPFEVPIPVAPPMGRPQLSHWANRSRRRRTRTVSRVFVSRGRGSLREGHGSARRR